MSPFMSASVLIPALFVIVKYWKQISTQQISKWTNYEVYVMEYSSAMKIKSIDVPVHGIIKLFIKNIFLDSLLCVTWYFLILIFIFLITSRGWASLIISVLGFYSWVFAKFSVELSFSFCIHWIFVIDVC